MTLGAKSRISDNSLQERLTMTLIYTLCSYMKQICCQEVDVLLWSLVSRQKVRQETVFLHATFDWAAPKVSRETWDQDSNSMQNIVWISPAFGNYSAIIDFWRSQHVYEDRVTEKLNDARPNCYHQMLEVYGIDILYLMHWTNYMCRELLHFRRRQLLKLTLPT